MSAYQYYEQRRQATEKFREATKVVKWLATGVLIAALGVLAFDATSADIDFGVDPIGWLAAISTPAAILGFIIIKDLGNVRVQREAGIAAYREGLAREGRE